MARKTMIVLAVLLVGAGMLTASDWVGTFSGDASGSWKGTLAPSVDPCFSGEWATSQDPPDTGTLRGDDIQIVGQYYHVEGTILDDGNNEIGSWEGDFPRFNDQIIYGTWETDEGSGTWTGWSN